MAIGTNGVANAQTPTQSPEPNAQPTVTTPAANQASHQEDAFHGLSHMVSGLTNLDEEGRTWLENKNRCDRTIDVTPFTALAHVARLHLTENGSLLFSYQMDGNVYNHQMTDKERAKLNDILKDGGLMPKDLQGNAIAQLFSKISVDQSMQNNIEENLANSMSKLNLNNNSLHR